MRDFIGLLERDFEVAYGQLQEGLRDDILSSFTVSVAQAYVKLYIVAKNVENRQVESRRRQHYCKTEPVPDEMLSDQTAVHSYSKSNPSGFCGEELPRTKDSKAQIMPHLWGA